MWTRVMCFLNEKNFKKLETIQIPVGLYMFVLCIVYVVAVEGE